MPTKKKKIVPLTTHKAIVNIFKEWFSALGVKAWWKKGPNAVRIRMSNGDDVIFTFNELNDWRLESSVMYGRSEQATKLAGK